jgi:hypothetical protein
MPKYIQHDDEIVLIPQHISRFGIYTCQFILINAYITYLNKYYVQGLLDFVLYTTSIIHWRKIKHSGIERKIDVCVLLVTFTHATYKSFLLPRFYTLLWIYSLLGGTSIFYVNEKLFYYQVIKKGEDKKEPYHYFSLEYTRPNTLERELAYYRSVITHGISLHVFLSLISIYCIINNPL